MSVKRYEFELYHCNGGEMLVSDTGDYVSYDDYAALEARCAALAAENAEMKAVCEDRRMFIMNGVQLGYIQVPTVETDPALETIRVAVSPQEPTPATDAFLAEARAQGVELFAESQKEYVRKNRDELDSMTRAAYCGSAVDAERFAAQLRKGVQS